MKKLRTGIAPWFSLQNLHKQEKSMTNEHIPQNPKIIQMHNQTQG